MKHREITTPGSQELDLFAQCWLPESEPRAVVVISHGLGEHSSRYGHVASRLVDQGHAVYALDHRGHGRSPGPRANIERFSYLVTDLATFAGRSARQHPGRPVFLVGHSMGGAIATATAVRIQDALRGLVLSGPALAAGEVVPPLKRRFVRLLSSLAPNAGAMKLPAEAVSRDPEVVRAYESDPLVFHGSVPARTVAEILQAMDSFPESVLKLRLPLLVQHGIADSLVPLEPCRPLFQSIPSKDKTLRFYDGLFHEVYNEPEKDRVLDDLAGWLAARC